MFILELVDEAELRAASFVSARSLYECGQTWKGAAAGPTLKSFLTSACQTNSKKIKSCLNKDRWKGIYISAYYPSQAIFLRRLPSVRHQASRRVKTSCPIHIQSGRSGTHNSPFYKKFIVFYAASNDLFTLWALVCNCVKLRGLNNPSG